MTLWLIDKNQKHYRLTDRFAPAFYVSGSEDRLACLQDAAQKQEDRQSGGNGISAAYHSRPGRILT